MTGRWKPPTDAQTEANWRDWQLEHGGYLDPDQPTETATIEHRRRMRAPFTSWERWKIRAALTHNTPDG